MGVPVVEFCLMSSGRPLSRILPHQVGVILHDFPVDFCVIWGSRGTARHPGPSRRAPKSSRQVLGGSEADFSSIFDGFGGAWARPETFFPLKYGHFLTTLC